jgi:nucleoside-diphosphate-sugar epimerase
MKIFISGATGFIGSRLAMRLAEEGNIVHALYRSDSRKISINHSNIIFFKGDILDYPSLETAISGCEQVYHVAAFTNVWDSDPSRIYRLNIEGSMNVIRAGIKTGVKKFVCTSTAGVFGPSGPDGFVDENSPKPEKYFTDYESSKAILEEILRTICRSGVNIVMVNPTRVYGPGLLSESNSVTKMIIKYTEGHWRIIPGNGKSIGNYVHVEDVVSGHLLAMERGVAGENYALGGSNLSYNEFFATLAKISGKKRQMVYIPVWLMILISMFSLFFSGFTRRDPYITPPLVRKFLKNWNVSSEKAKNDLSYKPMDLNSGLENTIKWFRDQSFRK